MFSKMDIKFTLLALFCIVTAPAQNYTRIENFFNEDSTSIQFRRGVELQHGYISYEAHYSGKNLNEEKRRKFPLREGTGVWTELNPKVPRVTYVGVHFVNKDTGWACGDLGALIKTTNGGENWTISETQTTNLLLKVHSYNGQIVIATGYDGMILRSTDEGKSFEQIIIGIGNGIDLWGVKMLNDTIGWVSGLNQTLIKTTDAGLTWLPVNAGLNAHYWALDFLDENYGMIACGGGVILKTTNGGSNWTQIQAGDTRALYSIDIIDSTHIAAAGYFGKNVYSSDGGLTWVSNPDLPVFTATNGISFLDKDTGYSVQDLYQIRKTTDHGQTWFNPNTLNEGGEWDIKIQLDGRGYSVGEAVKIYKLIEGVENWRRLILNEDWSDVFFINDNNGFLISSYFTSGLYKTEDGGISYQQVEGAPNGDDILFLDSLTGFIAGTHKSTDGGETWYAVNGGGTKVFFINDSVGWSIDSKIYKTIDRGENWFTQLTLPADYFSSIFFVDSLNGWATSRYIWQTTNGGQNWIERTDIPIFLPDDVHFTNLDTGWVGRYTIINNSLLKTTDGGLNWIGIPEVIGARNLFFFPDPIHWLTLGFSRYYWTNDYGNSWQEFTDDVPTGLISFFAPTNYFGYSVGKEGLILKYEDTTYVPVELISFEARSESNEIILLWATATELNNQGFYVERSVDNKSWETIGFVNGKGTTIETNYYKFIDCDLIINKIYYRLKQLDYNGTFTNSKIVEITVPINGFTLSQNFPNPVNPSTNISFSIPVKTNVKINLYSINGELVRELINEVKDKGIYYLDVDLVNLASGVYFYKMTTNEGYSNVKKIVLLK